MTLRPPPDDLTPQERMDWEEHQRLGSSAWDSLPRPARVAVVVFAILYFGALPLATLVRWLS